MAKDYYNVLGVAENASKDDIKKSFRSLAKKYHPDRNKGDKSSEERFKEISEAYEVLGDDKKRQQYDMMKKYGAFGGGGPGGGFHPGGMNGTGGFRTGNGQSFSFEDIGGFGSFADIFSSIFGGQDIFGGGGPQTGTRPQRQMRPQRGNDWHIKLSITFEQAIKGTTKTLSLNKPSSCHACHGTGTQAGSGHQVCTNCGGRGNVTHAQGGFSISRPCPVCLGRGTVPGQACTVCRGSGKIKEKKKVKINIPAGIDDGGKVRLRGMGYPGHNGGMDGDLIITVNTEKNQEFKRDGHDIHTSVEISFPQAVLGCKIPVKTLAQKINLTIPPGTEAGTVMRLKGLGLDVAGGHGDQYVTVKIKVPKTVTAEQKELLEKLAKTM
ncbi:MAG: molecular chaperone DnaJ [Candidatus Zixiibacteriota bacterium]